MLRFRVSELAEALMPRETTVELVCKVETGFARLRAAWLKYVRTLPPQMFMRFPAGNPPDRGEPDS